MDYRRAACELHIFVSTAVKLCLMHAERIAHFRC